MNFKICQMGLISRLEMTDKIISERGSGRVEIARREGGRGRPTPRERPRQAGDEKAWPPGTPPPSPGRGALDSGRRGISGEGHPAASAGSRPARASSGGGRVGHPMKKSVGRDKCAAKRTRPWPPHPELPSNTDGGLRQKATSPSGFTRPAEQRRRGERTRRCGAGRR